MESCRLLGSGGLVVFGRTVTARSLLAPDSTGTDAGSASISVACGGCAVPPGYSIGCPHDTGLLSCTKLVAGAVILVAGLMPIPLVSSASNRLHMYQILVHLSWVVFNSVSRFLHPNGSGVAPLQLV